MTTHYDEELSALLAGELTGAETRDVVAHLRECGECTSTLISVAVAHGSLRAARRAAMVSTPLVAPTPSAPLPELVVPRRHAPVWTRLAAAAVLVAAVALGVVASTSHHSAPNLAATAALHHVDAPTSATGRITVDATAAELQMNVVTKGLPTPPSNHYYEVWLFNPETNKMLPLGVLSLTGHGSYPIAKPIMSQFSAVDISLQDNDGSPQHSSTSVLRGAVIAA